MNNTELIPYVDLRAQWREERGELLPILESVLSSGQYIGGDEIIGFEEEVSENFGIKHIVSLNSGTDALICGLAAIGVGVGDEVITPANSFVASTAAIVHRKAKPVFVDVCPDQNIDPTLIEALITPKTRAIMPIHLTGRIADMRRILEVADAFSIPVIEDAAQSAGSKYYGRFSGSWGRIGCFSAHPLKNLNAMGDAGFIATDDNELASKIKLIRNHGLVDRNSAKEFGQSSRMDAIQAAILRYRLSRLPGVSERRRRNAALYYSKLNQHHVFIPAEKKHEFNTWHTFVIQAERRNELKDFLQARGIETAIHYPVPIHLQPAARHLGYKRGDLPVTESQAEKILTLPIHQYLSEGQISYVSESINKFYEK